MKEKSKELDNRKIGLKLHSCIPVFTKVSYACGIAVLTLGIAWMEIFPVIAGLLLILAGSLEED
jgi:hypothetical protein